MFKNKHALYIGTERNGGYTGFLAHVDRFAVIDSAGSHAREEGHALMEELKKKLDTKHIIDLTHFDQTIEEVFHAHKVPHSVSFAAGIVLDNILYLKTKGTGKIFIRRGDQCAVLIEGNHSASGHIQNGDSFLFSNEAFDHITGGIDKIKGYMQEENLHDMIEEISPLLKSKDDHGAVALFVRFEDTDVHEEAEPIYARPVDPEPETAEGPEEEQQEPTGEKPKRESPFKFFGTIKAKLAERQERMGKRNIITIGVVALLLIILIWSVGLGYKRRSAAEKEKKITATRELVTQKLDQAEEVAFLNLSRSESLISEAKQEVDKLESEVGAEEKGVQDLKKLVSDRENQITKKDEKKPEEFYDMALEDKQAKGNRMYLDEDTAAILDNTNGVVYLLSLQKKSLEKRKASKAKSATAVAVYDGNVFLFVPGDGIYKITADGEGKKVIENDSEWGEIKNMYVYNGNIYVLDREKSNVYKYVAIEDGYAEKSQYFKSTTPSFKDADSIMIDSSIYIDLKSRIVKYTAGNTDAFQNGIPDQDVDITKVYTDKNVTALYAWDKSKGTVYVLGKDGSYQKQVKAVVLAQADDIVVYEDNVFALQGQKIYSIALE